MSDKGVWRDATEADADTTKQCKVRGKNTYSGWRVFESALLIKITGTHPWRISAMRGDGGREVAYFTFCQVFDESPAEAKPDEEWVEPTVEMVGREVVAQFRNGDAEPWSKSFEGYLQKHSTYEKWSITDVPAWYRQCRVKLIETPKTEESKPVERVKRGRYASVDEMIADIAPEMLEEYRQQVNRGQKPATSEEPKDEAGKAVEGDEWREAKWPDDWGMACRQDAESEKGFLVGYDPCCETPWLIRYRRVDFPAHAATCQVNDRLPRFVMPAAGIPHK